MRNEISISIAVPPQRVWEVIADVERWPEWTESISSVKRLDDGEFKAGSRARVKQPRVPAVVWQVTALEPGRSFEWRNSSPGMRSVGDHRVEPEGDGSRVTLSVEQTGLMTKFLSAWLNNLTRRYLQIEAEGLKRRCEGG